MLNWYGIEAIKYEWLGTQSDPLVHYISMPMGW